ncbi:unnamed protein product [Psylliodes chrysocephalus]|uniref:Uncharacterized protein n=1 Tax=Psylliodes chrysocephalus TaxID=3402493 RepID=A0A9P0CK80_9CUCU|nr:unnamed protein product [Psylliodes chrysocephala]
MSGADAGHDSMRTVGSRVLRRRAPAPVTQEATAQQLREVEAIHSAEEQEAPLPAGSPTVRRTARRRPRTERIKWSRELNIDVMRAYYYVNQCDDNPLSGWRHSLHCEFTRRHPELQLTEQNIADRKNFIIRKGFLTHTELACIRREVGNLINQEQVVQNDLEQRPEHLAQQEELITPQEDLINRRRRHSVTQQRMAEKFYSLLSHYQDTDPLIRPALPKLKSIFKANYNIKMTNEIVKEYLTTPRTLEEVHLAIYCAAVFILELNGINQQAIRMPFNENESQPNADVDQIENTDDPDNQPQSDEDNIALDSDYEL